MLVQVSRNWWWLALRGFTAIIFGLIALGWHGTTLHSYMLLFGGLALVDGLLSVFAAFTDRAGVRRWWILLHGSVSIAISLCTWIWTDTAATVLLYAVSGWAVLTGLLQTIQGKQIEKHISNERLLRLNGMTSIVLAALVVQLSRSNILSTGGMVASFAILFGLSTVALSLNLRNLGKFMHAVQNL